MKPQHKLAGLVSALAMACFAASAAAEPTSMQNVMAVAIDSNPQIHQAEMNKQAIEFELEQAKGLYLPRVTLELSAGVRRLENATRRALGIANDELYPLEAGIRAEQTLIDFGRRRGEKLRQAARVDGAALRVVERSEFIALQSARQYLDVLLQQRVVAAAEDNMTFHNGLVADLSGGVSAGSISIADLQQAQERAKAASVRVSEAKEALQNAKIELLALSGLQVDEVQMPPAMAEKLPVSLSEAVGLTRTRHPKVLEAQADVDASNAEAKKAKGDFAPTIGLELSGRIGDDIDAFRGETNDLLGRVVLRWDIFDGGINRAKYQEMVRRASESRFRLHEAEPMPRPTRAAHGMRARRRPRCSATSSIRARRPTSCFCRTATSSGSVAARYSTCSMRRTRASMSRSAPKPRASRRCSRSIRSSPRPTICSTRSIWPHPNRAVSMHAKRSATARRRPPSFSVAVIRNDQQWIDSK